MNSETHIKRPMNCFMVWSREKRYNILKEHPGINNAEVSKALGAAWRKLSEEDKEPYVEEARRLNEQHKVENPGYKYQPKRRKPCKRNKRRAEKKAIASTAASFTKFETSGTTGGKIHFPFKGFPDPGIPQLEKMQGRPLIWFPSNHGPQCFSGSFQPSSLRLCSCPFLPTLSCRNSNLVMAPGLTNAVHPFNNFWSAPFFMSYSFDEKSLLESQVESRFFHNFKWSCSSQYSGTVASHKTYRSLIAQYGK